MNQRPTVGSWRTVSILCGWVLVFGLTGCGGGSIKFLYPSERIQFPSLQTSAPKVYFGLIKDLRPREQKEGRGRFIGITYPSDNAWQRPVTQIFRDALSQDVQQTNLAELVPLAGQADYTLEADILSFGCRLQRSAGAYIIPVALGLGAGMAWGDNSSDRLKRGSVLGAAGLMAIPLPAKHRAEAEVRLRLRDKAGEVVWQKECRGEIQEKTFLTATARDDQKLVTQFLVRALKRCNACLLGQMREEFLLP